MLCMLLYSAFCSIQPNPRIRIDSDLAESLSNDTIASFCLHILEILFIQIYSIPQKHLNITYFWLLEGNCGTRYLIISIFMANSEAQDIVWKSRFGFGSGFSEFWDSDESKNSGFGRTLLAFWQKINIFLCERNVLSSNLDRL